MLRLSLLALGSFCLVVILVARPLSLLFLEDDTKDIPAVPVQVAVPEEVAPAPVPELKEDIQPENENDTESLTDMGFGSSYDGMGPSVGGLAQGQGDGSSVQQTAPRVVRRVDPEYPASARQAKLEGLVLLKLRIGARGDLVDVQVVQSEPTGVFDKSAIEAVQRWTFKPAVQGGSAVAGFITQKIRFRME